MTGLVGKQDKREASLEAQVIEAVPYPLTRITTREIGPLFGRGPTWMERGEVRQKLFSEGFPRPISRGVWVKRDVVRFMLRQSAGALEQVTDVDEAGAKVPAASHPDIDEVMERTRRHLKNRRRRG